MLLVIVGWGEWKVALLGVHRVRTNLIVWHDSDKDDESCMGK